MFTEQQDKWLQRVEELFFRYGIRVLTMDDIARELGISKKTLYQFVENKDDLVGKVMERHIAQNCVQDEDIRAQSVDAIDQIVKAIRQIAAEARRIKPNVVFELQKYHREAWQTIDGFQREHTYKIILENIEWGRSDGYYRTDFDATVAVRFYLASTLAIFDDEVFPKPPFTYEHLFRECITNFVMGIATERGRALLKERLDEMKA